MLLDNLLHVALHTGAAQGSHAKEVEVDAGLPHKGQELKSVANVCNAGVLSMLHDRRAVKGEGLGKLTAPI